MIPKHIMISKTMDQQTSSSSMASIRDISRIDPFAYSSTYACIRLPACLPACQRTIAVVGGREVELIRWFHYIHLAFCSDGNADVGYMSGAGSGYGLGVSSSSQSMLSTPKIMCNISANRRRTLTSQTSSQCSRATAVIQTERAYTGRLQLLNLAIDSYGYPIPDERWI